MALRGRPSNRKARREPYMAIVALDALAAYGRLRYGLIYRLIPRVSRMDRTLAILKEKIVSQ